LRCFSRFLRAGVTERPACNPAECTKPFRH
jgi:hypothetical protein